MGHVEIRGPSVIVAYEGDHHADRIDADGWLRTGDLGHFDEDGYLYLDARTDDVINRGGEKVFPREIEEMVLVDPAVAAVAVVAAPDPEMGQVPVAYLVLHGVDDAMASRRCGGGAGAHPRAPRDGPGEEQAADLPQRRATRCRPGRRARCSGARCAESDVAVISRLDCR